MHSNKNTENLRRAANLDWTGTGTKNINLRNQTYYTVEEIQEKKMKRLFRDNEERTDS